MPILTNQQLKELVAEGRLIQDSVPECFQPSSYDLRIGSIFRDGQVIDATHARHAEQIALKPGEVITMTTLETLDLPSDIAGIACAINAQSSEGLLVLNPGHVDPGYKGSLTVMAVNMRRVPFLVSRKDRIFTVVFHRLDRATAYPYSSHLGNREDRERELNKKVVEKAVTSIGDLIALNAPFARPDDVKMIIRGHWSTIVTMLATGIALLASVVAAVFAVATFWQGPTQAVPRTLRQQQVTPAALTATSQENGSSQQSSQRQVVAPSEAPATGPVAAPVAAPAERQTSERKNGQQ